MTRIITISRQFGSGGRTVGRKTAEKLGIPCYDAEIIQKIAEKSGYSEAYVAEQSESEIAGFFGGLGNDIYGYSGKLAIWTSQCRVIKELAEKGDCVIVGRCADYVLRQEKDIELLKVFICADEEDRIHRIVHEYGETDVRPEKRLREKDKRRKAYYEIYTDQKYGDPVNYDMCLNTSSLGLDRCVDFIVGLYSEKDKKQ